MFRRPFSPRHMFTRYLALAFILPSISACVTNPSGSNIANEVMPVSQILTVNDLATATAKADTLPAHSTLVVFDIDDTLLTASEFFGSDKWYGWQRGRAQSQNGQPLVIDEADIVSCLFDTLGITYEIATNVPTQENMASLVTQVKHDMLLLTARSGAYRAATMRELNHNGLDFSDNDFAPEDIGYHYEITHGGRTATVTYVDGVFMVQGMDKGVLLLDLLARTGQNYETVLFVDDKTENINNMANAMQSAGINFYGFHYVKIDKNVTPAEVSEGQAAARDLTSFLSSHFAERADLIKDGKCAY